MDQGADRRPRGGSHRPAAERQLRWDEMTLRVIGAGLPRTGTMSLKLALERLLAGPCYHMREVFAHPDHVPVWHAAAQGSMPIWRDFFATYQAAVDAPTCFFWPELSAAYPSAVVLLSLRDADSWWESASQTVFRPHDSVSAEWQGMVEALDAARFTPRIDDPEAAKAAFRRHNQDVRERVPSGRLLEWHPSDGWGPLCGALGVPIPEEPFPHTNTREQWLAATRSG